MDHSEGMATEIEEQQAFLPSQQLEEADKWTEKKSRQRCSFKWLYLHLALEAILAVIIGILVADRVAEWRRAPVPSFPKKVYTFNPDPHFVHGPMLFDEHETLQTLHNWIPLSSDSRGYIQIPNSPSYPLLGEPYTTPINRVQDGPAYMMSVFHQLHCLSYVIKHFQQGYAGANLTEEKAFHSAHCFDYLRQSIMCSADTNLEGKTGSGPGWGSKHICRDYDALLIWANEHGTMKWRNSLLPGDAIL
ncbi:hypothetical protein F5Y16DRAFT_148829 [Xylariaceae sp. FL0255]|nr:hypothetical protein F5Y16DRAFT_148829 [Xylariaceae sp. FL0255]